MANSTTPITRTLNKEFKGRLPKGLRIQAGAEGSFLSIRIEDPDGLVSVKLARDINISADREFKVAIPEATRVPTMGPGYHMDGVVMNWSV